MVSRYTSLSLHINENVIKYAILRYPINYIVGINVKILVFQLTLLKTRITDFTYIMFLFYFIISSVNGMSVNNTIGTIPSIYRLK